jgi:hypothetical protein
MLATHGRDRASCHSASAHTLAFQVTVESLRRVSIATEFGRPAEASLPLHECALLSPYYSTASRSLGAFSSCPSQLSAALSGWSGGGGGSSGAAPEELWLRFSPAAPGRQQVRERFAAKLWLCAQPGIRAHSL